MSGPVARVTPVRGRPDDVVEVTGRLLAETRTEYLGLDDPSALVRADVPDAVVARHAQDVRGLVDRGVRIAQVTTPEGVEADHDDRRILQWRDGGEARLVDRLPVQACVIDRRVALVPTDLAVLANGALIVTHPVVVDVLVSLHRLLWQQGRDPRSPADTPPPPHLRGVLAMLASGLADDRAAQRSGVSARTYSRRVAELVDLLGSTSRFTAGVEAVRRGWL